MPPTLDKSKFFSHSPAAHSLPEHSQEIPAATSKRDEPPSRSPIMTLSSRKAKIVVWVMAILIVVGVIIGFTVGFKKGERYATNEMSILELETGTISPSRVSYTIADEIDVVFTNPNPGRYNWIAIAEAGADVHGKILSDDYYESWTYACGSDVDCVTGVDSGQVTFAVGEVRPGQYQAVLLSGDSPPYKVRASSIAFTVHGNDISTDQLAYDFDQDIRVTFDNPHAGRYNFIAIAEAGSDTDGKFLDDNFDEAWIYACGSVDDCDEGVENGQVTFSEGTVSPGVYQAYLVGNANPPYHIKSSSKAFLVNGPPTETPTTLRPTSIPTLVPTRKSTAPPATFRPTLSPTLVPTRKVTAPPATFRPTLSPTLIPTSKATAPPASASPALSPTAGTAAAATPTKLPTAGTIETADAATADVAIATADEKEPTYYPTYEPTREPTGNDVESITSTKAAFGPGEDVVLSFNNPIAGKWNWIMIGKSDVTANSKIPNQESVVDWVYACGSKECEVATTSGQVSFAKGTIPAGEYRAFLLVRNVSPPFHIRARTEPFTVSS